MGSCAHCGKSTLEGCGACKKVFYCNQKCATADWPTHQTECASQVDATTEVEARIFRGVRGLTNFERTFPNFYTAVFAIAEARVQMRSLDRNSDEALARWADQEAEAAKQIRKVNDAVDEFEKMIKGIRSRPGDAAITMEGPGKKLGDTMRQYALNYIDIIWVKTLDASSVVKLLPVDAMLEALDDIVTLEEGSDSRARVVDKLSDVNLGIVTYFDEAISGEDVNRKRKFRTEKIHTAELLGIELDNLYKAAVKDRREARGRQRKEKREARRDPRTGASIGCHMPGMTIGDIVRRSRKFDMLKNALSQTGLLGVLDGRGPFTVFAPSDKAWTQADDAVVRELMRDSEKLKRVLLYHVVAGDTSAADILAMGSGSIKSQQGSAISFDTRSGKVVLNDITRVIKADVRASNGVVHVIDSILIPPA